MTNRQEQYLAMIVESYIQNGEPVASSTFISEYNLDVSSATVRNEMNTLEKEGYLEKAHISSGRIPSTKGYQYYAQNLSDKEDKNLQDHLQDIFAKRRVSIDSTLDEAAKAISDIAGLTLVTSSSETDELLKSIQMTPLNDNAATIVLVTSTGRVESKLIETKENVALDDVRVAVRLFKERLIDAPLRELSPRVEALAPILAKSVKNAEAVLQAFVGKVFDFHNKIHSKVYGNSELVKHKGIEREDLANLLDLMESNSIWSSIEGKLDEDETMKIVFTNLFKFGHFSTHLAYFLTYISGGQMAYKIIKQFNPSEFKSLSKQKIVDIINLKEVDDICFRKRVEVDKVTNKDILKLLQSHIEDFNELKRGFNEHKKDFNKLSARIDNIVKKNNLVE